MGQEAIGATDSTHIEVPVDLELVREHVPPGVLPIYEQDLAGLREANADVDRVEAWTDSDGFVRRVAYDMPVSLEGETGTAHLAYDFSGFGQPIELGLPDPSLTVDAWDLLAGE